jgi:hypothetical protein
MKLQDLWARIERLEQVGIRLGKEMAIWREADHPLTKEEVEAYRDAIRNAHAALGEARVALAKAVARLELKA